MGQPYSFFIEMATTETKGAVTSFGSPLGAHVQYGTTESNTPIGTSDRVMHVLPGDRGNSDPATIISTHFTVPASPGNGKQVGHFPPDGLGKINIKQTFEDKGAAKEASFKALQRRLRWNHAVDKTHEELSSSCTKVGDGETARFLVPIDASTSSCPMSTLIRQNVERNDGFCGGHYSPKNRTTVTDNKQQVCTVMPAADFQQVFSQLNDNLKSKSPLKDGINFVVKSIKPGRLPDGKSASVQLHSTFSRNTTASVMDTDHKPILSKVSAAALMGETMGPDDVKIAGPGLGANDPLAARVFSMKLPGESAKVQETLQVPGHLATAKATGVSSQDDPNAKPVLPPVPLLPTTPVVGTSYRAPSPVLVGDGDGDSDSN